MDALDLHPSPPRTMDVTFERIRAFLLTLLPINEALVIPIFHQWLSDVPLFATNKNKIAIQ